MPHLVKVLHSFQLCVSLEYLLHLNHHLAVFRQDACSVEFQLGIGQRCEQSVQSLALVATRLLASHIQ